MSELIEDVNDTNFVDAVLDAKSAGSSGFLGAMVRTLPLAGADCRCAC